MAATAVLRFGELNRQPMWFGLKLSTYQLFQHPRGVYGLRVASAPVPSLRGRREEKRSLHGDEARAGRNY